MSADAGLFGHTMSWKEEVLLHDGSKIIAERHYNLGGYPVIESQERAALDVTVTFNPCPQYSSGPKAPIPIESKLKGLAHADPFV